MTKKNEIKSETFIEIIGKYIIPISFLHILLIYIYFLSFSTGFGANIEMFADSGIIFSIGISKIGQFYVLMGAAFLVTYFFMDAEPTNFKKERVFELHHTLKGKWMDVSDWIFFALFAGSAAVTYFISGKLIFGLIFVAAIIPLSKISGWIADKNGLSYKPFLISMIASLLVLNLVVNGLEDGEKIRNIKFAEITDKFPSCKEYLSLFSLGNNYIAAKSDERRYIINEKCEVIFSISFNKSKFDSYNAFVEGNSSGLNKLQ